MSTQVFTSLGESGAVEEAAIRKELESEIQRIAGRRWYWQYRLLTPSDAVGELVQPSILWGIVSRALGRPARRRDIVASDAMRRLPQVLPSLLGEMQGRRGWRAYICEDVLGMSEPTQEEVSEMIDRAVHFDEDEGWRVYGEYGAGPGYTAASAWDVLARYGLDPDGDLLPEGDSDGHGWSDPVQDSPYRPDRLRVVWTLSDEEASATARLERLSPATGEWVPYVGGASRREEIEATRIEGLDRAMDPDCRAASEYLLARAHGLHGLDITEDSVLSWEERA